MDLCSLFFEIFAFFCGKSLFGCGWPRWAFCAFLRPIRNPQFHMNRLARGGRVGHLGGVLSIL
jgi:hypothetical protein